MREGEVLVNGENVRNLELCRLREKIGFATQKAILFSGTVSSNVAYGASARQTNILESLQTAQAFDFVRKMDGSLHADIAQGGSNVSGGQKQRLSIARAICKQPEIYIFDDTFSALDYRTDRALRGALAKKTAGKTKIIVAQRIGTIMDADRIIVLSDGEIAGIGRHRELLKDCPVYREIAYSQLSEEELA